jgi:hypothetical protein
MTAYQNEVLNQRETTHGDYADNAHTAQMLKDCIRRGKNYDRLSAMQKESLDLIATKMGRILAGNPNEPDHWRDLGNYAHLVEHRLV